MRARHVYFVAEAETSSSMVLNTFAYPSFNTIVPFLLHIQAHAYTLETTPEISIPSNKQPNHLSQHRHPHSHPSNPPRPTREQRYLRTRPRHPTRRHHKRRAISRRLNRRHRHLARRRRRLSCTRNMDQRRDRDCWET